MNIRRVPLRIGVRREKNSLNYITKGLSESPGLSFLGLPITNTSSQSCTCAKADRPPVFIPSKKLVAEI